MELKPWALLFNPGWDENFKKFDKQTRQRILKKFQQMKRVLQARGLHSSRYQAEETGQYRIAFIQNDKAGTKTIYFVGDHKQYEKWYKK